MGRFWKKWNNELLFGLLFLGYSALTMVLFHRQSVNYGGGYMSDIPTYIEKIQGITTEYATPYPVMFWIGEFLAQFTTPQHAMAITVTVLNCLNAVIVKLVSDRFLGLGQGDDRWKKIACIAVFLFLFASMLYPLAWLGRYEPLEENFLFRYSGAFSPNPFHNATYLAARPFAVLAFWGAAVCLGKYEKKNCWFCPEYLLFSMALLLATMTKPSFTLVLVCTCGIIMIWRLFASRFRGGKAFWQFGIYFIPTFLDLLYQYKGVFVGGEGEAGQGIGLGFLKAWETAGDSVVLCILRGMAFPLLVLVFQWRYQRRQKEGSGSLVCGKGEKECGWYRLAWQVYLVGLCSFMFLYEKGTRVEHMNFAWGYMYGMFFAYLASLVILLQDTKKRRQPVWALAVQWGLFVLHVVCGIDYFGVLFAGGLYM